MGRVITLPGPELPGTGGYRVLLDRWRVAALLDKLGPDRLEVSDRTTLRWTGRWARHVGVPSIMVSHESLVGLAKFARIPGRRLADAFNAGTARSYDTVVCTTAWAAEEFRRIGAPNLVEVPLGVDLTTFHPAQREERVRDRYACRDEVLLVHCSRLSIEKKSDLAWQRWPRCALLACPRSLWSLATARADRHSSACQLGCRCALPVSAQPGVRRRAPRQC